MALGVAVKLGLLLGSAAYHATTVLAAAPIGQTISLRAGANSLFVSADQNLGTNAPLVANRTAIGGWEQFNMVDAGGGFIALQSVGNGRFVSADQNLGPNAPLVANRTAVGGWERFRWIELSGGQINLQSVGNGRFVSADLNLASNAPLVANRTSALGWETFTWDVVGGSTTPRFWAQRTRLRPVHVGGDHQNQIKSVFAPRDNQFGSGATRLCFPAWSIRVNTQLGLHAILGLGACPTTSSSRAMCTPTYSRNNNATRRSESRRAVGNAFRQLMQGRFRRRRFSPHASAGNMVLHQINGFASGGWMSDDLIDGNVNSGPQQQWISRNTQWGSWTGANWNMVFVGDVNTPAGRWPNPANTVVTQVPIVREKPFLQIDAFGNYSVRVPSLRTNSSGITWGGGSTPGTTLPISQFYIARSDVDTAATINSQLAAGKNLLFSPGVYNLTDTIRVTRANTVVLGLGYATLLANNGVTAMSVADVDGVIIAALFFDAGATNSPVLLEVGPSGSSASHAANLSLSDCSSGWAAPRWVARRSTCGSIATTRSWITPGSGVPTTARGWAGPATQAPTGWS
jgi:hypothetical protein